ASHKYVAENNGNWRIMAGSDVSNNSVLMQTELPALLAKTGDFQIDGLNKSVITAAGDLELQKSKVLTSAITQTYLSGVSGTSAGNYMAMTPEKLNQMLSDGQTKTDGKTHFERLNEFTSGLSPEVKTRYNAAVSVAMKGLDDLSTTLPVSTLARFGLVFGALGFIAAGQT